MYILHFNKEVFVKHEKASKHLNRGIDYLVYAHVLENQSFWAFSTNFWWLKVSKGTPTHQDLSFEPIHMSLRQNVTKIQPEKLMFQKTVV